MFGVMSYFVGMEEEALKEKAKKEKIDSITPKNQSNFEQKLLKFKKIYNESKNDLKKQKTLIDLIDFQKEFADSTNWAFENWYGTVSFELKNNGEVSADIKGSKFNKVTYSDLRIKKNSDVYNMFLDLENGDKVLISGSFKAANSDMKSYYTKKKTDYSSKDFLNDLEDFSTSLENPEKLENKTFGMSTSMTEYGIINKPTFYINLNSIKKIN